MKSMQVVFFFFILQVMNNIVDKNKNNLFLVILKLITDHSIQMP